MQKNNTIKALFFLGMFSMLLLHQVVPHWHHHHDHHHQHEPQKENPKKGFFDWFLEMHTHTSTTSDVLVLKQTTVEKITIEKEALITTVSANHLHNLVVYEADTTTKKWYQPPDKLQSTYFPNTSLRGPPSLG